MSLLSRGDRRNNWIDICKGIGIITVAIGHITQSPLRTYIFWFHMPLFFFISGYLYKKDSNYFEFFKKKLSYFGIPYLSILLLLSLPGYAKNLRDFFLVSKSQAMLDIIDVTWKKIYGGAYLDGYFSVFWFITCLFFTQQLYNWLYCYFEGKFQEKYFFGICIIGFYALGMLEAWKLKDIFFPGNIDVAIMALSFYCLGHLAKLKQLSISINGKGLLIRLNILAIGFCVFLDRIGCLNMDFDMKYKNYGVPILNFILAIACIFILQTLSELLVNVPYVSDIFSALGRSSLIIMYFHSPVQSIVQKVPLLNYEVSKIIAILIVCYFLYENILKKNISRKLFLGQISNS